MLPYGILQQHLNVVFSPIPQESDLKQLQSHATVYQYYLHIIYIMLNFKMVVKNTSVENATAINKRFTNQ